MAADISEFLKEMYDVPKPIPEYVEINKIWHDQIDSIWPEAPDLKYYSTSYDIFLPNLSIQPDQTIKDACIRVYFEYINPRINAFKETPTYKINSISNFWSEQAPDAPPLKLSVQETVHGPQIVLDNKDVFDKLIETEEDLKESFDALVVELNIMNHVLPDNITYDIILYINTHGATTFESKLDPEVECLDDTFEIDMRTGETVKKPGRIQLHSPPPSKQITFLTATQLGIDNVDGDELPKIQSHILETMYKTQTFDIYKLQKWLQTRKKKQLSLKGYVKVVGPRVGMETVKRYARSVGWKIAHNYVNRIYIPDPKYNPKIAIIYVKPGTEIHKDTLNLFEIIQDEIGGRSDMTTRNQHISPHIYRTELITYLYEHGYNHPLIIDSSCGGFYTRKLPTDRGARAIAHTATLVKEGEGAAGGKTKKGKKRKKGKTKKQRKTIKIF